MSANKRLKMQLRSDSQKRRSFSERVCDDLSEELLQYLTIEDKLRLECVSKQFQRTVFTKHHEIEIKWGEKRGNFRFEVDCKRLTIVLKKTPNISEIKIELNIENMSEVLKTIVEYCHHLKELQLYH